MNPVSEQHAPSQMSGEMEGGELYLNTSQFSYISTSRHSSKLVLDRAGFSISEQLATWQDGNVYKSPVCKYMCCLHSHQMERSQFQRR